MYVVIRAGGLKMPAYDAAGKEVGQKLLPEGSEVTDFAAWPYTHIMAHLRLDWVIWKGEGQPPHTLHRNNVIDLKRYRGEDLPPRAPKTTENDHHAPAAKTVTDRNSPLPEPAICGLCQGKTFKNKAALASHARSKHPERKPAETPQAAG